MMISGTKKSINEVQSNKTTQQKPQKQDKKFSAPVKKATTVTQKKDTKKQAKKEQIPKDEPKNLEQQLEEQKQDIQFQIEETRIEEPKPSVIEDKYGNSVIKYSHYKDKFPHKNGIIYWEAIDDKYCFSAVFEGNFYLNIRKDGTKVYLESNNELKYTSGLEDGFIYVVEIVEDEIAESQKQKINVAYEAPNKKNDCPFIKQNQRTAFLTDELKGLSIEEIQEKGDRYKQLIEARDLEDCLYN